MITPRPRTPASQPWRAAHALWAGAALLAGCTLLAPAALPTGTPIADARARLAGPVAEYPRPGGGTRLEFAQGTLGKEKHMLDFDAAGRLQATTQVLTAENLARIAPGTPRDEVRFRIGRPAHVFAVPWQHLQVWNYRFAGGDCVWFQISISNDTNRVTEASTGLDPACDGPKVRE